MARDTTDETALTGVEQLAGYLAGGCKPKDAWRIGTEHEKFPFYTADNSPVPYEGPRGIKALLEGMQATLGWEPIIDEGNIIGLVEPTGQGAISDRKSTRLNSSHVKISYAVFCLRKKQ